MLVLSRNPTIVEASGYNENNPIIGWDNQLTAANVVADSEDINYPATNLANPATIPLQSWKAAALTSPQYITITPAGTSPIDYMGIAGHNLGTIGAVLTVQYELASNIGVWVDAATFTPAGDSPIIVRFEPQFITRIRLKLVLSTVFLPSIAAIYVGKLIVMQRRIYVGHTPITMARQSTYYSPLSESGKFLGRLLIRRGLSSNANFQNLTPGWYRTYLEPAIAANMDRPFFFAWRPGTYPLEVGFVWLTSDPKPTNQLSNGMMQVSLDFSGIIK